MRDMVYYRTWCKTCKDWTLHEDNICRICDTKFTECLLRDIPDDKLRAQRERYRDQKREEEADFMQRYLHPRNPLLDMLFEEVHHKYRIVESDAGQKRLDEIARERQVKKRMEWEEQRAKDRAKELKYRKLGRNELCLCGSEKKYKLCCWSQIQKIRR